MSSKTDTPAVLRIFLRKLLESGTADAVFALRKTPADGRYCYSLVSDPNLVDEVVVPFHPVMPVQGARALASLTSAEALRKNVVALLRPCELSACTELAKQYQLSMENVTVLSCTCPGVFPALSLTGDDGNDLIKAYETAVGLGKNPVGIRKACTECDSITPRIRVPMTVVIAADNGSGTGTVCVDSDLASDITGLLTDSGATVSQDDPEVTVRGIQESRSGNRELTLVAPAFEDGLDGLVNHFAGCTGCGGCRAACPVCSCVLCDYDSARLDLGQRVLESELSARGALRIPAGTVRFHLGRLNHIGPYCVSCGQCTDACPAGIAVSDVFRRSGAAVQNRMGYSAGAIPDGEPALATYLEMELDDITDY